MEASSEQTRRKSKEIEQQLAKDKAKFEKLMREPQMLLLGSGDSGKTTFIRQIKILHGGGFTDDERRSYLKHIVANTMDSILSLVKAAEQGGYDLEAKAAATKMIDTLSEYTSRPSIEDTYTLFRELAPDIDLVWRDPAIQRLFSDSGKLHIIVQDTADYFLNQVTAIADPAYLPTDQDIIHARFPTTQVSETTVQINTGRFHFYDCGGQVSHRKHWAPYFDKVHTILFVASLASYDQVLVEDPTVNRMHDAITLFGEICNHSLLRHIPITLFLNKQDLFEKKFKNSEIKKHFPDYHHSSDNIKKAYRYFERKFTSQNQEPNKKIYTHVTCCTDTKTMEVVVTTVANSMLNIGLRQGGLMI
ncbi:guanine nucleotide binding protein, alpha subunit [Entophlyctis helioformis]|nr:guanine nucleotide binding protein, alpha subunit [Entophlyctis helioformis]